MAQPCHRIDFESSIRAAVTSATNRPPSQGHLDVVRGSLAKADTRQCFEDNHVTISHFSTSGVLPPDMMEESRYTVREALPAWPGQSMIASTPKLGPVAMGRLDDDAGGIQLEYGEADGLGFGDHLGWYRGRWFVRLPSAKEFAGRCLHQHYVIARDPGEHVVLETLLHTLLRITRL